MPSESYKRVCKEFHNGNVSPVIAKEAGISVQDFTILLTVFRKIDDNGDMRQMMRAISEKLIESGMEQDEFIRITGYAKGSSKRMYNEIMGWNLQETDKGNYLKQVNEVCEQFGLDKSRTIKEQWF